MINIMYLVLTAILALNVSAEILNAFKVVDSSLQKSNTSIEESNKTLFQSLQDKMKKPESAEKATLWYGNAKKAQDISEVLYTKIEQYKADLKKASGLDLANGVTTYKEDDLEAATHLFINNAKGPELLQELTKLKADLLAIAPEVGKEFGNKLPIDLTIPPSTTGSKNTWEYNYFHMTPTVAAVTILSKFENDIKNAENQVITFCHNQIGKVVVEYTGSVGLVSQSSDYVMPGQKIKVKAGVGIFSEKSGVNISIGGQSFPNAKGFAQTEMDAGGVGKHTIPVTITYPDQQGKLVTVLDKVEYTVGVPGGAAIMLDKMNVFYIGVDNPITISSGSGWDRTTVNMTGGTISGSGSNRIVKVSAIGAAKLTVTADGKTSNFDFRVKRIPDPIIKVGLSGGGRLQAVNFRSQGFVRADLENFDFDAKFAVTGATVYFNIPGDRNVKQATLTSGNLSPCKQYMDLLVPGSTVTFDNIKVVGPDGVSRTIQNPPGFSLF
jgi:gliding motility-associated protein GldM